MPPAPRSIFDRLRTKIDAPILLTLPFDRQFADFLFDPDVCWIWKGAYSTGKRGSDRPVIQLAGRGSPVCHVSRVMLCLRDGTPLFEDRRDEQAAHSCDNPPCVNPFHLEWKSGGTNQREQRERMRAVAETLAEVGVRS